MNFKQKLLFSTILLVTAFIADKAFPQAPLEDEEKKEVIINERLQPTFLKKK